jgi:membrane protease YdiL (CAAX protease family)
MAPRGDEEWPAGGPATGSPTAPPNAPRPPLAAPPLYPHLPPPPSWATGSPAGPSAPGLPAGSWYPPPGPPARPDGGDRSFLDRPDSVPATRGDGFAWVLFALVGFVIGQLVGLAFIYGVAGALGQTARVPRLSTAAVPPEWFIGASLVGLWVGLFGGAFLGSVARGTKRIVADLGIRFRLIDLVGIGIGVGGQIVVALMYEPFIHHIHNFNAPTNKLTGGSHGGGFAVIAILTVFGAPFFEEVFFRGLLFKGLTRLLAGRAPAGTGRTVAVAAAIVLDGALFGLAHGELVQLAGLATFGMALAFISYKTGRLGMNMVSHASFNAVAVVAIVFSRAGVVH